MSENFKSPMSEDANSVVASEQPLSSGLTSDALARRRMLLKSLSKGSAVVAAASVPMHSLAAIGTLSVTADGKRCTMSGTMSGVHSKETTSAVCAGWSPGYYHKIEHWPNYNATNNPSGLNSITGGSGTFDKDTLFSALFGSGPNQKLLFIMTSVSLYQDEFHWIAALLNGSSGSPAINFPYSAASVIALYKDTNKRADALKFFKDYMETHT